MGRHAIAEDPPGPRHGGQPRPRGRAGSLAVAAAVAVTTAVAATVAGVVFAGSADDPADTGPQVLRGAGGQARAGCAETVEVWLVADDDLVPALGALDEAPLGPDADGTCARVVRLAQGPAETLATLGSGMDTPRRADVWVPDASLWAARAQEAGVAVERVGSLGTSPVVVASSPAALDALGWTAAPPTWQQVMGSETPLAVPQLQDSSSVVLALAAARGSVADEEAGMLTVQAMLSRQRLGALSPSEGLVQAAGGAADAPLVLTSELEVLRRTGGEEALLGAVAPSGATAVLDFPVLTVPPVGERSPAEAAGVQMVVDALVSEPGRSAALAAGLRGPDMEVLAGSSALVSVAGPYVYPDTEAAAAVTEDLARLAPPSQLLVVVDVSLSMSAEVGDGSRRVDVAAAALDGALEDLPGAARVSLWKFASSLGPGTDHVEVLPMRRLDDTVDGRAQRELLDEAVAALPGSLVAGGTSLYDTVDAAMVSAREQWDPSTVSTVVVITDGRNEDSTGLDLPGLAARLSERADPARPVGLVAVAFGPDADIAALEQVAAAATSAGGAAQAVDARDPDALEVLLVRLLAARTQTPPATP